MKKRFLSMILLAVISFSLVACGNSETTNNEPKASEVNSQQEAEEPQEIEQSKKNEKFNLYQEWKDIQTGNSIVFDKDGTVIYNENAYKYEYNEKIDVITVYLSSSINLNVIEEEIFKLSNDNLCFVPVEYFDEYHLQFAVFYGVWTNDIMSFNVNTRLPHGIAIDYLVDSEYGIKGTSYNTVYTIDENMLIYSYDGKEYKYLIDTSVEPMTLTEVGNETIILTKTE